MILTPGDAQTAMNSAPCPDANISGMVKNLSRVVFFVVNIRNLLE